jgi:hypothetical protein
LLPPSLSSSWFSSPPLPLPLRVITDPDDQVEEEKNNNQNNKGGDNDNMTKW